MTEKACLLCGHDAEEYSWSQYVLTRMRCGFCGDYAVDDRIAMECEKADECKIQVRPRGGVYFEAGFALGLDIPVIWTVHKPQLEQIHFDARQYNFIAYETADELRAKLKHRIDATIAPVV